MVPVEEPGDAQTPSVEDSLAEAEQEIKQLQEALNSRLVIGQAEGILMASFGVDPDQAIAYLKRVSSVTNRKVIEIAAEIVETKQLPAVDGER